MTHASLFHRDEPLSQPAQQRRILQPNDHYAPFSESLASSGLSPLRAVDIEVLQVNVGRVCNQSCRHCHVDAGPDRRERMSRETALACIRALETSDIPTLDITGGAPEMNPSFRTLVVQARRLDREVIDRSNLTILNAPGYEDLPEFLSEHRVRIVASLPCYLAENVDAQRGDGIFDQSIQALRRLNAIGYGRGDTGLVLDLVYNPVGPALPPSQSQLEVAYKKELRDRYNVVFDRLLTITNMPVGRFLHSLVSNRQYDDYMALLVKNYNPEAAANVMCRTTLSVQWDGRLYDCDFNQMLDLRLADGMPATIYEFDAVRLGKRRIMTGQHCYGCTAGIGSGCQGALQDQPSPAPS